MLRFIGVLLTCCVAGSACRPVCDSHARPALEYLGQRQVPHGAHVEGTVVGGLSAISYDSDRDCYYVISDDRSATGPARFYEVRLALSDRDLPGIADVAFTGVRSLLDDTGRVFPPQSFDRRPAVVPPDPEGIAFDARRQRLYWSSEGERRTDTAVGPVLADPWIRIAGLDGGYLGRFTMPPDTVMSPDRSGPRRNTSLEGLTLAPSGRLLFAGMEGPGYDDGSPPDRDHGALTRITAFDVDTAAPAAQYAYPLEPAAAAAKTNGLTDLVALSETEFLVVERAFSATPTVRVFRARVGDATDVLSVPSLTGAAVTPMVKTLVADLSATPGLFPLDNVEGITLGPRLSDGRRSVVLVSDDNFSPRQVTQFLLLAMR